MKNLENKEVGLKSIFSFAVNALLLLFLIILGIETVKIGQLFIGILYFVLSALVLVPHHLLKITYPLKVVLVVLLSIVVATVSAQSVPPVEQKYDYYTPKQTINLTLGGKPFSMVVKEVKYDALLSTEQKEKLNTSGSFIIVTVDVVNLGLEAVDFKLGTNPELIDSQNRHFTILGKGVAIGKLQPGVAKEVSYVYEVPKEISGLKFVVRDSSKTAKSVDLNK